MMTRIAVSGAAIVLSLAAAAPQVSGQVLHTNHDWEECAIVLDENLTPAAWRQFTSELGIVTYFRPMSSARPLGPKHFEVALLNWGSRIDDSDPAWNDTFSHPDGDHVLFEGSSLYIPGVMVRAGVSDRVDVGAYYTKSIGANYGFIGGQVQYNVLNDAARQLAAAGRISMVRLYGPDDVDASTYGIDFVVSKAVGVLEPYVGVSGYLASAQETTSKVDLEDETALGAQATLGVAARVSVLRLGAEYNIAKVSGISMKVGFGL